MSHIAVKLNPLFNSKPATNTTLWRYPPHCLSQHTQEIVGSWTVLWEQQAHCWSPLLVTQQHCLPCMNTVSPAMAIYYQKLRTMRMSSVLTLPQMQPTYNLRWLYDLRCQEAASPTPFCHPLPALWARKSRILNQKKYSSFLKGWHRKESTLSLWQVIAGLSNKSKSITRVMPLNREAF